MHKCTERGPECVLRLRRWGLGVLHGCLSLLIQSLHWSHVHDQIRHFLLHNHRFGLHARAPPRLPCWPIYNFNCRRLLAGFMPEFCNILHHIFSVDLWLWVCIWYVFTSTYCCSWTNAGGRDNKGGVGIQGDVLHIPVVNSRLNSRQQKGSFPLNIIQPSTLRMLLERGRSRSILCDTLARDLSYRLPL